jgi:hypothetical protein
VKAGGLALKLIESADPGGSATVTLEGEVDAEAISHMSLSQLLAFAEAHDLPIPEAPEQPVIEAQEVDLEAMKRPPRSES